MKITERKENLGGLGAIALANLKVHRLAEVTGRVRLRLPLTARACRRAGEGPWTD